MTIQQCPLSFAIRSCKEGKTSDFLILSCLVFSGYIVVFRCNTASAKTGGVLNISAKFDPEGATERGWEGEGNDPNSSR